MIKEMVYEFRKKIHIANLLVIPPANVTLADSVVHFEKLSDREKELLFKQKQWDHLSPSFLACDIPVTNPGWIDPQ